MPHLAKPRFVASGQCHDLLWWKVHQPEGPELERDISLEDRFEQGREVGLAYCKLDTWPTLRLLEKLRELGAEERV